MRALVKTAPGPGDLELRDVPVPEIGDDDVLMRVTCCGVCGSDLHMETGVHVCDPPVVLGHEYTGVVERTGPNVTDFGEGDPVSYLFGWDPFPGVGSDGGFEEFMRVPARCLWPTPEGLSPEEACQFETVIVPLALVRDVAGLRPGERVVVTGPGTIGCLTANVAKLEGAAHVTVLGGPGDEKVRLPKALEMGADEAVPFGEEALAALTGEEAPDCWFETSGAPEAVAAAASHVKPRGRIAVSGLGRGLASVDMARVAYRNIHIYGVWGGNEDYIRESAELMLEGKLKVASIVSAVMPLTQWREAFAMLRAKEAVKIVLDPSR
jgi:alcohol dehydrogenase/L-iditol 2-dehydrogenase